MSAPATDTKDPERPDHVKTALAAAGAVAPVVTFIAGQPTDNVLKYVTYLVPLALVGGGLVLPYFKMDSATKDLKGNPYRIRRFPKWLSNACWWSAGVTALVFAVVWFGLRDDVLPVVVLDEFKGVRYVVPMQDQNRTDATYVPVVRKNAPPPAVGRVRLGGFTAYPAAVATISRHGSGKVVIESVRVKVEEPDTSQSEAQTSFTIGPAAVLPNQYLVKIARGQDEAEAQLYRDGQPSAALPVMDDNEPIARLHVGMEGEPGTFLVKLVVTVRDQRGRKQTITSDGQLVVNTDIKHAPIPKEEDEEMNRMIEEAKKRRAAKKTKP